MEDQQNERTTDQQNQGEHSHSTNEQDDCAKCQEYLAGWKRAQADYQNLKRESDQQKTEFVKYANERLLEELLPVIDQYAMVIQYQPSTDGLTDEQKKSWDNWLIGVKAVWSNWERVMDSIGLKLIAAEGVFNPQHHEAVGTETVEGRESGEIIRVTQSGWILNGKVLRPTKVIIQS